MFEDQQTPQTPQTLPPKKPAPPQPPASAPAQKPPDNLPIGGELEELPEDIFEGSDSDVRITRIAPSPEIQKVPQEVADDIGKPSIEPKPAISPEMPPLQLPHHERATSRKVLIFILSAVLVAFLIIAFYLVYRIVKVRDNAAVYNQPISVSQPETQETPEQPAPIVTRPKVEEPIEPQPEPQPKPIIEPEPLPDEVPPETQPEPEPPPPVDSDGDGLTDLLELEIGSNPQVIDTDLDGLDDYSEVKIYKSNPVKRDTDGDGYDDGVEVENGYNPIGSGKL